MRVEWQLQSTVSVTGFQCSSKQASGRLQKKCCVHIQLCVWLCIVCVRKLIPVPPRWWPRERIMQQDADPSTRPEQPPKSATAQKQGTPAKLFFFLSFLVLPLSTYTFHCCIRSHSVGLLWARDRPFEETSTRQHTTPTRDRHRRHSGIRTRNPIKGEAAAAYLWPRGHRDRRPPVCLSQNHTVATEQKTGKDMAHCCPHTTRHKLSCSSETKAGRP